MNASKSMKTSETSEKTTEKSEQKHPSKYMKTMDLGFLLSEQKKSRKRIEDSENQRKKWKKHWKKQKNTIRSIWKPWI